MGHRRRYSDEEKAYALAALDANGGKVSLTAHELGIHEASLRRIRDSKGKLVQLHDDKKLELADIYEQLQRKILPAAEDKINQTGFRELMTGAGIAADKMAMLRGDEPPDKGRVNVFVQMNQEVKDTPGFPRK